MPHKLEWMIDEEINTSLFVHYAQILSWILGREGQLMEDFMVKNWYKILLIL